MRPECCQAVREGNAKSVSAAQYELSSRLRSAQAREWGGTDVRIQLRQEKGARFWSKLDSTEPMSI